MEKVVVHVTTTRRGTLVDPEAQGWECGGDGREWDVEIIVDFLRGSGSRHAWWLYGKVGGGRSGVGGGGGWDEEEGCRARWWWWCGNSDGRRVVVVLVDVS